MISELEAEAIGVNLALIIGNCDECKYQKQCEGDEKFVFPSDAACTKIKEKILKNAEVKS